MFEGEYCPDCCLVSVGDTVGTDEGDCLRRVVVSGESVCDLYETSVASVVADGY